MTMLVHKAEPEAADREIGVSHCQVCGQPVNRVPGGHGSTWIHTDRGTVAAPNPPNYRRQDGTEILEFSTFARTRTDPEEGSRRVALKGEVLTDTVLTVTVDGRAAGEVHRGINGEWYHVSLSKVSHAYPLGSLDNISGTGWPDPQTAAMKGLNLRPYHT